MSSPRLICQDGTSIILGPELARGGEGRVLHIQGKPDRIAKIYFKPPDREKSDKIKCMVAAVNERLAKLSAWPLASLHNHSGQLVGFVMQKLEDYKPLFELYLPKLRLQKFPKADWRFLIHAATNTARAFSAIHESGHVIGDINHGNLLVANDATVKFIDTDSFQITSSGKHWLCEVGVQTHQPPEMQYLSTYRGIIRTPNHDNFGLAVLIFQLLCLARHPFSGKFLGKGDMPIEKAIAEYRFAFARDHRQTQMQPPPASLTMDSFPMSISTLFERAFTSPYRSSRPTAKEWITALNSLSSSLKICSRNQGHHYFSALPACPWCDIEVKGSSLLFPISAQFTQSYKHNFMALWQQVMAIQSPGIAPPFPNVSSAQASPSKESQEIRKNLKFLKLVISFVTCLPALIGTSLIIHGAHFMGGVILTSSIWIARWFFNSTKKEMAEEIINQFKAAQTRWNVITTAWKSWATDAHFIQNKSCLDDLKNKYDRLESEKQELIRQAFALSKDQQLLKHLQGHSIASAGIYGIGTQRVTTLQSYGISTAADVASWRLSGISGFGPKLAQRLLDWRHCCEMGFAFDPNQGAVRSNLQSIEKNTVLKRQNLEQSLASGLLDMRKIVDLTLERRTQLHAQAMSEMQAYAQALANAREIKLKP